MNLLTRSLITLLLLLLTLLSGFGVPVFAVGVYNANGLDVCVTIKNGSANSVLCENKGRFLSIQCEEQKAGETKFKVTVFKRDNTTQECRSPQHSEALPGQTLIYDGTKLCCCRTSSKTDC